MCMYVVRECMVNVFSRVWVCSVCKCVCGEWAWWGRNIWWVSGESLIIEWLHCDWVSGEYVSMVISVWVCSQCMSMCKCMMVLWRVREYMTNAWSARERMMSVWWVFECVNSYWVRMINGQSVYEFIHFVGKFSQWWWENVCDNWPYFWWWAPK